MAIESNGKIRQEIIDYIDSTLFASLATVRGDGTPSVRTIAAFALGNGGSSIYFATLPNAEKTKHISGNNRVSFFFQHESQKLEKFRNAELIGKASKIDDSNEVIQVAGLISDRSPFVKAHIEQNGIDTFAFYEVTALEVKFLDYSKGIGPQAIEVVSL